MGMTRYPSTSKIRVTAPILIVFLFCTVVSCTATLNRMNMLLQINLLYPSDSNKFTAY